MYICVAAPMALVVHIQYILYSMYVHMHMCTPKKTVQANDNTRTLVYPALAPYC